jgi:hypothetical protein
MLEVIETTNLYNNRPELVGDGQRGAEWLGEEEGKKSQTLINCACAPEP